METTRKPIIEVEFSEAISAMLPHIKEHTKTDRIELIRVNYANQYDGLDVWVIEYEDERSGVRHKVEFMEERENGKIDIIDVENKNNK